MLDFRNKHVRTKGSRLSALTAASTLVTAGVVCFLASPLLADRLVTTDGSVIETRGPWEVRGKTVVFTTPKGTLSSVRASEIDFDATEVANLAVPASPASPASPSPPARRESVLVLTDDDIGRGQTPSTADGATLGVDATGEPTEPSEFESDPSTSPSAAAEGTPSGSNSVFDAAVDLEIRDWRVVDDGQIGGIEVVGTVINRSVIVAVDLGVTVRFEGQSGEETHEAFMGSPMVGPGRVVDFRIPLPSIVSPPDEPTFEVQGRGLRPRILGGVDDEANESDGAGEGEPKTP